MENVRHEAPPDATVREAYEQNYHNTIIPYLGRLAAKERSNYRIEQPRSSEHLGRQEELIAILQSAIDLTGA